MAGSRKDENVQQNAGYFGPESITWQIASEAILTLGGTRAVLMQLAHPLVAAGVHEHSRYMHDPFGRAETTFLLGQMLTFGSQQTAREAAHTINHLHTQVHGYLPNSYNHEYPAGTCYYAQDPALLLWVHATLIDTILHTYPIFVGPLAEEQQEQYYQESKRMAHLLGLLPAAMPATARDLRNYVETMVHSTHLTATPQARQIAQKVLFPPATSLLRPALRLNLQVTCALLPVPIRAIYGLEWDDRQQQIFDHSAMLVRALVSHLPMYLRVLPSTRKRMQEADAQKSTHPLQSR